MVGKDHAVSFDLRKERTGMLCGELQSALARFTSFMSACRTLERERKKVPCKVPS